MSFVRKKKNAESHDGVARHRKMKSAGSQTDFCLTADQRAAAWSNIICFGLCERVERNGWFRSGQHLQTNVRDSKAAVRIPSSRHGPRESSAGQGSVDPFDILHKNWQTSPLVLL